MKKILLKCFLIIFIIITIFICLRYKEFIILQYKSLKGDRYSKILIAEKYWKGDIGFSIDCEKSRGILKELCDEEDAYACNELADSYAQIIEYTCKNNYIKARNLYERSLEIDNHKNPAYLGLGKLYEEGKGVRQDCTKASELYHKLGEEGISFLYLGSLYENKKCKDIKKSQYYYGKACDNNIEIACERYNSLNK